jgi:hypothetical protein
MKAAAIAEPMHALGGFLVLTACVFKPLPRTLGRRP